MCVPWCYLGAGSRFSHFQAVFVSANNEVEGGTVLFVPAAVDS